MDAALAAVFNPLIQALNQSGECIVASIAVPLHGLPAELVLSATLVPLKTQSALPVSTNPHHAYPLPPSAASQGLYNQGPMTSNIPLPLPPRGAGVGFATANRY
jgi:hypothetical protein